LILFNHTIYNVCLMDYMSPLLFFPSLRPLLVHVSRCTSRPRLIGRLIFFFSNNLPFYNWVAVEEKEKYLFGRVCCEPKRKKQKAMILLEVPNRILEETILSRFQA